MLFAFIVATSSPAGAHGQPIDGLESRNSFCTKTASRPELNKENPACAKAYQGPEKDQPGYDPFESNQANGSEHTANGEIGPLIKDVVPDGQLCGAGRDKYAGFNTPTDAWPYRSYEPGASLRYKYTAWAHHPGIIELYISKEGYDPTTEPLGWDDIEDEPFETISTDETNGQSEEYGSATYEKDITLPDREGRAIVAAIWIRSDSPEVFYNCSDVVLQEGADGEIYNLGATPGEVAAPVVDNSDSQPSQPSDDAMAQQTPEPASPETETETEELSSDAEQRESALASTTVTSDSNSDSFSWSSFLLGAIFSLVLIVGMFVAYRLGVRSSPTPPSPIPTTPPMP